MLPLAPKSKRLPCNAVETALATQ
jgi:hypothetical protein